MSAPTFGEWLPIETAPKNGEELIFYSPDLCAVCIGYHSPTRKKWILSGSQGMEQIEPTHWMPLPTPPKTKE